MPGAAASEAVGPIFASALTLTLSIVSIAWGSWAQADVILNQANTSLTGYGIGVANAEQIRLFEEDRVLGAQVSRRATENLAQGDAGRRQLCWHELQWVR